MLRCFGGAVRWCEAVCDGMGAVVRVCRVCRLRYWMSEEAGSGVKAEVRWWSDFDSYEVG